MGFGIMPGGYGDLIAPGGTRRGGCTDADAARESGRVRLDLDPVPDREGLVQRRDEKNPVEARGVNGAEGRKMRVESAIASEQAIAGGAGVISLRSNQTESNRIESPDGAVGRLKDTLTTAHCDTRQSHPRFLSHPEDLCAGPPDCPNHRSVFRSPTEVYAISKLAVHSPGGGAWGESAVGVEAGTKKSM